LELTEEKIVMMKTRKSAITTKVIMASLFLKVPLYKGKRRSWLCYFTTRKL